MIQLLTDPNVFFGQDILVDLFSAIVVLMIGVFSIQNYRLSKNRNHLWIAGSFFMLGLAFIFEVLTNFTIYKEVLVTKNIGLLTLTFKGLMPTNTLFVIGILGYQILTLVGLYLLYTLYQSKRSLPTFIITTYLLLISLFFIQRVDIFHMTAALLLILITAEYFQTYRKNRLATTRMLMLSFGIIALSHFVSIFIISPEMHAIAGIVQLAGYVLLLITFILVLKNAKKTR